MHLSSGACEHGLDGHRPRAAARARPAVTRVPAREHPYTGHEPEHVDDLINMRGRWYDSATRRFLTRDPIVTGADTSQGWNPYSYVHNRPFRFVDPTGYEGCPPTVCYTRGDGVEVIHVTPEFVQLSVDYASSSYGTSGSGEAPLAGISTDRPWQGSAPSEWENPAVLDQEGSSLGNLFQEEDATEGLGLCDAGNCLATRGARRPPRGAPMPGGGGPVLRPLLRAPRVPLPRGPTLWGSFNISDWSQYPSWAPRPSGPFRLLFGQEYEAARSAANAVNAALRRAAPEAFAGKQIHEIHPVGGSPTDLANKIALTPTEHAELTRFWNHLMRQIEPIR